MTRIGRICADPPTPNNSWFFRDHPISIEPTEGMGNAITVIVGMARAG